MQQLIETSGNNGGNVVAGKLLANKIPPLTLSANLKG